MTWIKFHEELTAGAKRGLKRAHRFVFMELSLKARARGGFVELAIGMADEAAVLDLLGGDAREVKDAIKALVSAGMISFDGEAGARRLVVVSWDKWNDAPGGSTERVKRHRERAATDQKRATAPPVTRYMPVTERDETETERVGNSPRVEKSREEKIRADPISPEPSVPLSPPETAPPERQAAANGPEPFSEPARRIRAVLAASPRMRPVATADFATRLAHHCREGGHAGRFALDDVLAAIGEADAKLETDASIGEHAPPRTIARLVEGCVRTGPRKPAAESDGTVVELPRSSNVVPPRGAVGGI